MLEYIFEFLNRHSIPLVGKLTGNNFALYEKLNIPMLMMFLDLEVFNSFETILLLLLSLFYI